MWPKVSGEDEKGRVRERGRDRVEKKERREIKKENTGSAELQWPWSDGKQQADSLQIISGLCTVARRFWCVTRFR